MGRGNTTPTVLEDYLAYMKGPLGSGVPFNRLARPLLGLYVTAARRWRRRLTEYASRYLTDQGSLGTQTPSAQRGLHPSTEPEPYR